MSSSRTEKPYYRIKFLPGGNWYWDRAPAAKPIPGLEKKPLSDRELVFMKGLPGTKISRSLEATLNKRGVSMVFRESEYIQTVYFNNMCIAMSPCNNYVRE